MRRTIYLSAALFLVNTNLIYAQSIEESISYIKEKLVINPENEWRRFVDITFAEEHIWYSYNTYGPDGMEGRPVTKHRDVVPLKKIKPFTENDAKFWKKDSNAPERIYLECEDDASNCITAQTCAPTGSNPCDDKKVTNISVDISNLTQINRVRVIDAFIHIKKLYPSTLTKEMFDK